MKEEKITVIDLNLTRGLVVLLALALLAAAFLGYLAWSHGEVAASGPQAPPAALRDSPLASTANMRQYYLTKTTYDGMGAGGSSVCASGYHMASMWEIVDPSNLKYNTTLGHTMADSGQGPPETGGWVRTGFLANTSNEAGLANCDAWTDNFSGYYGTVASLPWGWLPTGLFPPNFDVWYVTTNACDGTFSVWCVEN
jgi:hypothetical protein